MVYPLSRPLTREPEMYRVLLVDDHELVRCGIRRLLEDSDCVEVVGEADSGEKAIPLVKHYKPDVVLMDVNMPGIGGLEATRRLLQIDADLRVVVVSVFGNDPFPTLFLEAGAAGYITKGCSVDEMVAAIRTVCTGGRYIGSAIAQVMALNLLPGAQKSPFEKLSQRELQVMLMVAQGQKVQEISDKLCLSPKTISTYRHRLFDKLGVHNDVELAHLAMRHGVIAG